MTLKIDRFGGIMPRVHPTLLSDGMAVRAHNVKLKSGKLVPIRQASRVQTSHAVVLCGSLARIGDAGSIHVWRRRDGGFDFLAFKGMTWLAHGNLADDERMRVILSGDTEYDDPSLGDTPVMYVRDPVDQSLITSVPLWKDALPKPAVSNSSGTPSSGTIRYTVFFWTWVDKYGYESPVSPASDEVSYNDGNTINIGSVSQQGIPEGAVKIRVYKVVSGTESENIQFVCEVERGGEQGQFTFPISCSVKDEDTGEVIPLIEAPPKDLRCIQEVPGAFYCGFSQSHPHTVAFSDVNLPYSWPVAFRYDVHDSVVALAVTSNSVFALTDGWPYVLSGTAPDGMVVTKLAGPASCVSARSVCVYKNAVYYASPQGMMVIANSADAGTVCANLTDKYFTKDQWLALKPETCVCGQYDGALHLFFNGGVDDFGNAVTGLRIDLLDDGKVAVTTHDDNAACVCVDDAEDRMYFVRHAAM